MTFPDEKFDRIGAFWDAYAERLSAAAASVDHGRLNQAAELLERAYARGNFVYVGGNGGSAAIANSFVGDHAKLVQTDTDLRPRIVSLASNIPMLTAIANDISYADVFLYQLRTEAKANDLLLVISSSGDSENVVRAAAWGREAGLDVIAFTGFTGGRLKDLAHVHLHVEADNYGIIEDVHQSLMHVLAQYIRQRHMAAELIRQRKF